MAFTVEFLGTAASIEVDEGTSLLEAAFDAGVPIATTCGGQGTCGRCRVRVHSGEVRQRAAGAHTVKPGDDLKLACLTTVHSDVAVEVVGAGVKDEQAIIAATRLHNVAELDPAVVLEPPVVRYVVEITPPDLGDPTPDLERLTRAVAGTCATCRGGTVTAEPRVVPKLANTLRESDWKVAVTVLTDPECPTIVDVDHAARCSDQLALAIDIGTTTVVVQLLDCGTGAVLAEASDYNEQHTFGEDVVSRIVFSLKGDGLDRLKEAVCATIDRLIADALSKAGAEASCVTHAVIAGNTTMIHLLYGLTPRYIREDPYVPTVSEMPWKKATDIGFGALPNAWVFSLPAVASWVGGDITAGILASGTAERGELELYLDIGTNGEIVLGNREWLLTCSCSAGPAFEGGGIKHGMRAAPGAIESVFIEDRLEAPTVVTIGHVPARGICGSGLMDLVGELFLTGILEPNGRFDRSLADDRLRADSHGVWHYVIVDADESATGEPIVLTEPDLDNLIRAKAAIYAAMSLLAESVGLSLDAVERFTVAGGFGNKIKIRKAIDIGLLPDLPPDRVNFFGNGAIKGALLCAASVAKLQTSRELVNRMSYVELSVNPAFMERYVSAMFLPHTHADLFPSVKAALSERERGAA